MSWSMLLQSVLGFILRCSGKCRKQRCHTVRIDASSALCWQLKPLLYGAGDWLESVCSMQRLAPEAMEGISRGVYDKQQASSAAADVWSLGVLLYELGTGKAPFPGALQSGRPLRPDSELNAEEKLEFFDNVLQRLFMYQVLLFSQYTLLSQ